MRILSALLTTLLLLTVSPVKAANLLENSLNADRETVTESPATESWSDWQTSVQDILINALSLTGIKYRYGGSSPETGFDCSGFVRYVFSEAANIALPHNARAISQIGNMISPDKLEPGDLVFFNTMKKTFSHVGIYLGNNRFIHAPSSGGGIYVAEMGDAYWSKRFDGARRIVGTPPQATHRAVVR